MSIKSSRTIITMERTRIRRRIKEIWRFWNISLFVRGNLEAGAPHRATARGTFQVHGTGLFLGNN
jgi:hypothetical protein